MKTDSIWYFDPSKEAEPRKLAYALRTLIEHVMHREFKRGILLLCIGTDRSTGDSLGPLIGHELKQKKLRSFRVVGTLENPVHAVNLEQATAMIRACYPEYLVIAVDASVGRQSHVGRVTLGVGSIRPGLGVSKNLSAVGDIFITGIVGGYENPDPLMLQSVRLSLVMKMAEYISESIFLVEQFFECPSLV